MKKINTHSVIMLVTAIVITSGIFAQSPPATPPTPTVSTNTCGNKTLTAAFPPAKVTYYWQTGAGGTSMANSNSELIATTSGTYYLRAYNFFDDLWSTNSASAAVTVTQNPAAPSTPSFTDNCYEGTLTRGTPPSGVTWYWQGTNSSGTSTSNSAATYPITSSGTYYIRANTGDAGVHQARRWLLR